MTLGDVCLQNLDQPVDALKHYRAAITLDPSFVSGHVRIAELEIERGEAGIAREEIEMIKRLAPQSPAITALEERLSQMKSKKEPRD